MHFSNFLKNSSHQNSRKTNFPIKIDGEKWKKILKTGVFRNFLPKNLFTKS